jgi:ribosomal protein L9
MIIRLLATWGHNVDRNYVYRKYENISQQGIHCIEMKLYQDIL